RPGYDQAQVRSPWTGQGGTYVDRKSKTNVRMFPQCGPLESPAADTLREVHETGRGASAAYQPCRGERKGTVRPLPSPRRPQGQRVLPPYGGTGGMGARLIGARSIPLRAEDRGL